MLKNRETDHEIDEDIHAEAVALAHDLLEYLEEYDYPEHQIDLVKGICGELNEYVGHEEDLNKEVNYEEMKDEDLEELHYKSIKDKNK